MFAAKDPFLATVMQFTQLSNAKLKVSHIVFLFMIGNFEITL